MGKMLRKGIFTGRHFNLSVPSAPFFLLEDDPITTCSIQRLITNVTVTRQFSRIFNCEGGDRVKITQVVGLLEQMLTLEPEKRVTPIQALKHVFCEVEHT